MIPINLSTLCDVKRFHASDAGFLDALLLCGVVGAVVLGECREALVCQVVGFLGAVHGCVVCWGTGAGLRRK